ncbi:unnamed protein product [Lactuca virosa]|uniref:Uncharacterized protein n=1 Tax=Lactuca virosa TaxID=75947 RepID=A0AAU9MY17_9ASTR|nr:unnamed protein product [Lactuca virosa]
MYRKDKRTGTHPVKASYRAVKDFPKSRLPSPESQQALALVFSVRWQQMKPKSHCLIVFSDQHVQALSCPLVVGHLHSNKALFCKLSKRSQVKLVFNFKSKYCRFWSENFPPLRSFPLFANQGIYLHRFKKKLTVSTRSRVKMIQDRDEEENTHLQNHHQVRNPHHGLEERMKALTRLYEWQKQSSINFINSSPKPDANLSKCGSFGQS